MKLEATQAMLFALLIFTLGCCAFARAQDPVSNPNIVLIYTDDQGFGDCGVLNPDAKFKTPNLDRLANEGLSFTNAHCAASVCTPSRYGLLTGRYPWRTHLKRGVYGAEHKCLIEDGRTTIASLLKQKNYHTAMVGKWHLGMDFPGNSWKNRDWSEPTRDMPVDKGFDYFFGIPASLNYGVLAWFENRHAKVPPTLRTQKKPNKRHVDYRIMPPYQEPSDPTKRKHLEVASDFIDNQCLTRFTDQAIAWMGGKIADSKNGKPFFLYLPYTSPHYPVCPLPEFHGQGEAGGYGEFMIETDHHVGRILEFLAKSGIAENTLVIFSSDNGPERSWESRIKEFQHDSRGGLRGGKRSVYEGGHRVPFLVRWPVGIKQPGRQIDSLIGQVDVLATIASVVKAELPDDGGEDSVSFANMFHKPKGDDSGSAQSPHEKLRAPLITHGNDGRYAITEGQWKLILGKNSQTHELYDLRNDRVEKINVRDANPEKVKALMAKINQIVTQGRTTAGPAQANDTGYWKDLVWLKQADYQSISSKVDVDENAPKQEQAQVKPGVTPESKQPANSAVSKVFAGKRADFHGFDRYTFETDGVEVSVVCPEKSAPGKPWLWRSIFWGSTKGATRRVTLMDLELVKQGYHVVIRPGDVSGHPSGNAAMDAAYRYLTQQHGFSKKAAMGSMSRETLALFRWASSNPDKVASIYVDNGVCNVKSWPAGKIVDGTGSSAKGSAKSWKLLKTTYGFKSDEEAIAAKISPIDWLEPLAKAGVPILLASGTHDDTVPYEENAKIVKDRYGELGGSAEVILENKKHHPHGLKDSAPVIEFIKKHT